MNCPKCDAAKIPTQETRSTRFVTWRVRRCHKCSWKVTTKEVYAPVSEQSIPKSVRRPNEKPKCKTSTI